MAGEEAGDDVAAGRGVGALERLDVGHGERLVRAVVEQVAVRAHDDGARGVDDFVLDAIFGRGNGGSVYGGVAVAVVALGSGGLDGLVELRGGDDAERGGWVRVRSVEDLVGVVVGLPEQVIRLEDPIFTQRYGPTAGSSACVRCAARVETAHSSHVRIREDLQHLQGVRGQPQRDVGIGLDDAIHGCQTWFGVFDLVPLVAP